jgi:hypothetical protein
MRLGSLSVASYDSKGEAPDASSTVCGVNPSYRPRFELSATSVLFGSVTRHTAAVWNVVCVFRRVLRPVKYDVGSRSRFPPSSVQLHRSFARIPDVVTPVSHSLCQVGSQSSRRRRACEDGAAVNPLVKVVLLQGIDSSNVCSVWSRLVAVLPTERTGPVASGCALDMGTPVEFRPEL